MPLPQIMSFDDWKEDTFVKWSPRSELLKDIDEAIKTYNVDKTDENLSDLKVAFSLWTHSKKDFLTSIRNTKNSAPLKLKLQLFNDLNPDSADIQKMKEAQRDVCLEMFRRCQMKFKSKSKTAQQFVSNVKKLLDALGLTGFSVPDMVQEIIKKIKRGAECFVSPAESTIGSTAESTIGSKAKSTIGGIINKVVNFVLGLVKALKVTASEFVDMLKKEIAKLLENLLLHLIPLASTVEFIGDFAPKVYALAKKQMDITSTRRATCYFAHADPQSALISFTGALQSERNAMGVDLAADIVIAVTDVFAPVGAQAVKWANDFRQTLTSIVQTIGHCREIQQVNKLFKSNNSQSFSLDLFKTSPLAACYLITSCSQSQLVAMLPGTGHSFSTWIKHSKHVIEHHVKPMRVLALDYLDKHPCEIDGIGDASRKDAKLVREVTLNKQKYLDDIAHAAHLSEIRRFDSGTLTSRGTKIGSGIGLLDQLTWFDQKKLASVTTKIGSGRGLLDELTWFDKTTLTPTDTKIVDPLDQIKFELSLKRINNDILRKTWLNKMAFDRKAIGVKVISVPEWKKLSWVTWGRRHEFTQQIDKGLLDYGSLFQQKKGHYLQGVNRQSLPNCLKEIKQRIDFLSFHVLVPLYNWLDPKNKVHQASKRLKAMSTLRVLIDNEISQLSKLHSQYDSKRRQAQKLFS